MNPAQRKRRAAILRITRKIHRTTGILLFVFFFITAMTGLLLGWKKHTGGAILADTKTGQSNNPNDWLPMHTLRERAINIFRTQISATVSSDIDRIDVRPDKGMAKFLFVEGYWGIQLDCTTGELLQIERRRADFIENIHDGVILDNLLGTSTEQIKLVYTTILGTALLIFTITGFWLWVGPRQFHHRKPHIVSKPTSVKPDL